MKIRNGNGTVSLTIRGCPARVHQGLKALAAGHKRSLNAEAIEVLTRAVPPHRKTSHQKLLRQIAKAHFSGGLTAREARAAILEGRQ